MLYANKKTLLWSLIYILFLIILTQCRQINSYPPNNTLKENNINTSNVTKNKKKPCWITHMPKNCEDFSNDAEIWSFYKDSLIIDSKEAIIEINESKNTNCSQQAINKYKSDLKEMLASEFIEELTCTIKSEIESKISCREEKCQDKISHKLNIKSRFEMNPDEIELIDYYCENLDNEQQFWGLGRVKKSYYNNQLQLLLKQTRSEFTQPVKNEEDSDKKNISVTNNQKKITVHKINCDNNKLKFITLPKTKDKIIEMIENEFTQIYNSKIKEKGYYPGNNVLETHSEKFKRNKNTNIINSEIQKEFFNNMKCWQAFSKEVDNNYMEDIRKLMTDINNHDNNVNRLNDCLNTWAFSIKSINALRKEADTFKKFYNNKQTLQSRYFLTLTLACSNDIGHNIDFIRSNADELAKKEILKTGILIKIENEYNEQDTYYNETLRSSYTARITPEFFEKLQLTPNQVKDHYRGRFRKFKIDMVEKEHKKLQQSPDFDIKSTKSFIISGSEAISVKEDNGKFYCDNISTIQNNSYKRWIDFINNEKLIISSDEKDKIRELINGTVYDNCRSHILRKENDKQKNEKLNEIENKINDFKDTIQKNIRLFSKILKALNIIENEVTFTNDLSNNEIISQQKKEYQIKYIEPYNKKLIQLRDKHWKFINNQPRIKQILIEAPYDYLEIGKKVKDEINKKLNKNMDSLCPDINWGHKLFFNKKKINDEMGSISIEPQLNEFLIPQILIVNDPIDDFAQCSVPILLKINCVSQQKTFLFHADTNEIEDIENEYFWKTNLINQQYIPMRRKKGSEKFISISSLNNDDLSYKFYNDYKTFCSAYNQYRDNMIQGYDSKNLPEIKCIKQFNKLDNNNFFDNIRSEQWQIRNEANYYEMLITSKNTNWMTNTFANLEQLFFEVKRAFEENEIDKDIIMMLSGKAFWTNTKIDNQYISVAFFDFTKNYLIEEPRKKNDKFFIIFTKKISFL